MGLRAAFEKLVPDLSQTFLRFPVPVLASVAVTLLLVIDGTLGPSSNQIVLGGIAAFFGGGIGHLIGEGRGLPRVTNWLAATVLGLAAFLLAYLSHLFVTQPVFLFLGLAPLLMIAPYLGRNAEQGALWLFNLRLGLAAMIAFIVALVFALGLAALIEALDALFDIRVERLQERVWIASVFLVAPLYALSLMPKTLDEEIDVTPQKGSLLDRGISVLVNYIAVPVIAAYALILHAYAVKIAVSGELPRGQIATMVTIFAVGGTATWLVAWPWREQGTKLLRLFMGWWFFLLVVPSVMLVLSIWRRIADYGVTSDRYGILLVAVWVAVLMAYMAVRRARADMRVILGAAAFLLLFGSFGPWGANGLTISSQMQRLTALLEEQGILKDGVVSVQTSMVKAEIGSAGSSMIFALKDADGLDRLMPWFETAASNPFHTGDTDWLLANKLNEAFGFEPPSPGTGSSVAYVAFSANRAGSFDIPAGAVLTGPFWTSSHHQPGPAQQALAVTSDDVSFTISLGTASYRIEQLKILNEAQARTKANPGGQQEPLRFELAPGLIMLVEDVSGYTDAVRPAGNIRFWVIRLRQP